MIPKWMMHSLHGAGKLDHEYTDYGADSPTLQWSAVRPDFKAKVVCESCNNGWMSALEVDAQTLVTSLMRGTPQTLRPAEAAVLARWGAKTALMFQALEPLVNRVVPAELYPQFRRSSTLPSTVRVWAGRVQALGAFQHAFGGKIAHRGRHARMFTSLVAFDRLTLMVMGSRDAGLVQALEIGHLGNAWVEVGPLREAVDWPAHFTFDTTNFMAMPQLLPELAMIPPGALLGPTT
ncbi:hypothetical protein OJ997_14295 [Solirubrobacter phytolaccae]|uniref:Uncharacterized protein n=1 Tax=Solirubrobacter phytolaccae TaxID=1404360 RepID=A0A9X3N8M4_9ACTN|nr:hypothetical protein [Solirubrobacter phytolaccae]MDA0181471.1 hypothetical protein [Solirubrobacter phytolaccae]